MARLDTQTGRLSKPTRASDSVRPGFIVIHPDERHIYATESTGSAPGGTAGFVSAYQIKEPEGTLADMSTQPSGGLGPCHVSIDPSGTHLLVANYHGGSCAILPILPDGTLGAATSIQQHSGSGPHLIRQTAAHTHSINCDPTGRFALAADLGMDKIMIYRLNTASGTLMPNDPPFIKTESGDGPRHLTFHPSGKFVYACMELGNTVVTYEYKNGTLTKIQTRPTLPAECDSKNDASEICLTPDGRFLYVGNRGHDSLAIFAIDPESGKLTALGHEPTRGKHPRNFTIDPSGTFLIVANMHSDNAVVFRIDRATGKLEFTGNEIRVPAVSCVKFLAVQ